MKKLVGLVILGVLGFYLVWPAWSGYRIWSALESQDAALLESKIDFPSVRESLKPAVTGEVEKQFDAEAKKLGGGLPIGELKKQVLPKIVDAAVASIVTPANILRIYREGGDVGATVARIMKDEMGKTGGLPGLGGVGAVLGGAGGLAGMAGQLGIPGMGGAKQSETQPAPEPKSQPAPAGDKPKYGFANIKRFGLAGPLGIDLGVAKDAAKSGPDISVGMSFTGLDWKLTRLIPSL